MKFGAVSPNRALIVSLFLVCFGCLDLCVDLFRVTHSSYLILAEKALIGYELFPGHASESERGRHCLLNSQSFTTALADGSESPDKLKTSLTWNYRHHIRPGDVGDYAGT